MIGSCWRAGGFLPGLTRPPPVALFTLGFCGARKIKAAPPVMSRTRLPPPLMSCAITATTEKPIIKETRGKSRCFMGVNASPHRQITTHLARTQEGETGGGYLYTTCSAE